MNVDIELLEAEQRWSDFFSGKKSKTVSKVINSKPFYPNRKAIILKNKSMLSRMFGPQEKKFFITAPSYWANETYPLLVQVGAEVMEIGRYETMDRTEGILHISRRAVPPSKITWHYKKTKVQHIA